MKTIRAQAGRMITRRHFLHSAAATDRLSAGRESRRRVSSRDHLR
jgi:hypothetical protein